MTTAKIKSDDTSIPTEFCLALAAEAAETAKRFFRRPIGVEFKEDESPVTQADRAIETLVRDRITARYPDHGIVGEEHGIEGADRGRIWVIDPIDGTRSFISGHPLFGFLLAHLDQGVPQLGLIGMPMLGETYLGLRDGGASCNGKPIRASNQTLLGLATVYINEGDKIATYHPALFQKLLRLGRTRRFGYDCYPHALLAAGHVDVVIDYDLKPYDFLALRPVVTGAGGVLTDWQGRTPGLDYEGPVVSAATPELHEEVLDILKDHPAPAPRPGG